METLPAHPVGPVADKLSIWLLDTGLYGLDVDQGGRRCLRSRHTWFRDRSVCRRDGLVLADADEDPVQVELSAVIEEALDADCWGVG